MRIRTIRKPIREVRSCIGCGDDFEYMRTLNARKLCRTCDIIRRRQRAKAFRDAAKSDLARTKKAPF